jgi:hypothetical protein
MYICRIVFFLLYNNFIPISLYVTIELVNVGQAYLIGSDEEIYSDVLDAPCCVRSSNLGQELGTRLNCIVYCMHVCKYIYVMSCMHYIDVLV